MKHMCSVKPALWLFVAWQFLRQAVQCTICLGRAFSTVIPAPALEVFILLGRGWIKHRRFSPSGGVVHLHGTFLRLHPLMAGRKT